MTDEKKLKLIQESKDKAIYIYDQFRFNPEIHNNSKLFTAFKYLKEMMLMLDMLSNDSIESMPNCVQLIAQENTIIENEQSIEISTNLTGLMVNENDIEFVFNGFVPSEGYLKLRSQETEEGLKFFVENCVPISVSEKHDLCGYKYCDLTTTEYFSPGIYQIEKGTVIGIAISKNKHIDLTSLKEKQSIIVLNKKTCI